MNDSKPGRLLRRIPGKPRARDEALADYDEAWARFKPEVPDVLRRLYLGDRRELFRWRVALDCGCVIEEWTRGTDKFPDDYPQRDPLTDHPAQMLRDGERQCRGQHSVVERGRSPYRDIEEWVSRRVIDFPADPEEDPHDPPMAPDLWAVMRHPEPHQGASWQVRLSCDHYTTTASDVDFDPEEGPELTSPRRLAEIRQEHREYLDEHPEGDVDGHIGRMLDRGWPSPSTETTCFWCGGGTAQIMAYQRVGFLVERPKPRKPPEPKAERLRDRLAVLEREQEDLRQELAELESRTPPSQC